MEIAEQSILTFLGVDIISVNLNCSLPATEQKQAIDIKIEPQIYFSNNQKRVFRIIMDVYIGLENFFSIHVVAAGNFVINEDINDDIKKSLMNANAPAIMFPYIRSFISTLTSNCGNSIKPIILPTQFFKGEIEQIILDEEEED